MKMIILKESGEKRKGENDKFTHLQNILTHLQQKWNNDDDCFYTVKSGLVSLIEGVCCFVLLTRG